MVFTADHGDNLGSHGRSGKDLPYDKSVRVPMIYSHVNSLPSRVDDRTVAGLVDVAPTLLRAVDLDVPEHMAGADVLNDEVGIGIAEIFPGNMLARTSRFTAHMSIHPEPRRLAFFDNANDPFQMRNLVEEDAFPDAQRHLFDVLKAHHSEVATMPMTSRDVVRVTISFGGADCIPYALPPETGHDARASGRRLH